MSDEDLRMRVMELEDQLAAAQEEIDRLREDLEHPDRTRENEIYSLDRRAVLSETKNKGTRPPFEKYVRERQAALFIALLILSLAAGAALCALWPRAPAHKRAKPTPSQWRGLDDAWMMPCPAQRRVLLC
jgi:uncharacterized small protein (DUF1192 family)